MLINSSSSSEYISGTKYCLIFSYLLLAVLYSMNAWMFWHLPELLIPSVFFAGFFLIVITTRNAFSFQSNVIVVFAMLALALGINANMNGYIFALFKFMPFVLFVSLKDSVQISIYNNLRNAFCLLLVLSLIGWVFYLAGRDLIPGVLDVYGWSERRNDFQYIFENHFIYVVNLRMENYIINRFSAIYMEPGYFGCLLCVLLYIERFDFSKWTTKTMLVSLVLTFSLAGYLVFAFSFASTKISDSQNRFFKLILMVCVFFLFYEFFASYNGGDNPVNQLIFSRLEYDAERGIAGNNRVEEYFDNWFNTSFIFSPDVFFGNHENYLRLFEGSVNVGWKYYVANMGLLGLFTYILYLWKVIKEFKVDYFTICLLFIYLLIFSRGHLTNFLFYFMALYYFMLQNTI